MLDPSLTDIGIVAAAGLYIIKEILSFATKAIAARKNGGTIPTVPGVPQAMAQGIKDLERDYLNPIKRMTKDLHDWHNVNDRDGVKIWYVRPSLAEALSELSINISAQTDVLKEMLRLQHETISKLEE